MADWKKIYAMKAEREKKNKNRYAPKYRMLAESICFTEWTKQESEEGIVGKLSDF